MVPFFKLARVIIDEGRQASCQVAEVLTGLEEEDGSVPRLSQTIIEEIAAKLKLDDQFFFHCSCIRCHSFSTNFSAVRLMQC